MLLTTHPTDQQKTNGGVPEVGEDKAAGGGTTGPYVNVTPRLEVRGVKKKTVGDKQLIYKGQFDKRVI